MTMKITIKNQCSVEDQHGDEIAVLNTGERVTYLAHVPGGMVRVRCGDYADMAPVGIIHPAATVELS
jgi:hypothetical protein